MGVSQNPKCSAIKLQLGLTPPVFRDAPGACSSAAFGSVRTAARPTSPTGLSAPGGSAPRSASGPFLTSAPGSRSGVRTGKPSASASSRSSTIRPLSCPARHPLHSRPRPSASPSACCGTESCSTSLPTVLAVAEGGPPDQLPERRRGFAAAGAAPQHRRGARLAVGRRAIRPAGPAAGTGPDRSPAPCRSRRAGRPHGQSGLRHSPLGPGCASAAVLAGCWAATSKQWA